MQHWSRNGAGEVCIYTEPLNRLWSFGKIIPADWTSVPSFFGDDVYAVCGNLNGSLLFRSSAQLRAGLYGLDWSSTYEHLVESTGPLVALRVKSLEWSPTTELFQPCIAPLNTLRELELIYICASSSDRRVAMQILGTALPELTILLWRTTREEITSLWEVFNETISHTITRADECFAALRYVAFSAPKSPNRARMRANVKRADGALMPAWEETTLTAGEALGVPSELDHIQYNPDPF